MQHISADIIADNYIKTKHVKEKHPSTSVRVVVAQFVHQVDK